jgi:hypothetical protein
LEQGKVPAQPSDIKKRIELLIEREYMERDEKERNDCDLPGREGVLLAVG